MGAHEWILLAVGLAAALVVAVEVQRSKRITEAPTVESTTDTSHVGGPPDPRPWNVLLVGHNAVTRLSVRRALDGEATVTEAVTAAEGLRHLPAIAEPNIDVTVIVDLTGDQGDADDFVATLRAKLKSKYVHLLVLTTEPDETRPPEPSGNVRYLAKPQSIRTLIEVTRRSHYVDEPLDRADP